MFPMNPTLTQNEITKITETRQKEILLNAVTVSESYALAPIK